MKLNVFKAEDVFDTISCEKLSELIGNKESFTIINCKRKLMFEMSKTLEAIIESYGYKCTIFTRGRILAASIVPLPFAAAILGSIAAHRLVTYTAEYEIKRNFITRTFTLVHVDEDTKKERERVKEAKKRRKERLAKEKLEMKTAKQEKKFKK